MPKEKAYSGNIQGEYLKLQTGSDKKDGRRPFRASDCGDLGACEGFRKQILSEIRKNITSIQDVSLGEFRIREINDEINKRIREKRHWERQIRSLGGPNHTILEDDIAAGNRPAGSGGYAYFGAAKDLPGVRELFEVEPQGPVKRTRTDMYKSITPDYYGFKEDEDDKLLRIESRAENKARSRKITEVREAHKLRGADGEDTYDYVLEDDNTAKHIPSQKEVENRILEQRKRQLLERYGITSELLQVCYFFISCLLLESRRC